MKISRIFAAICIVFTIQIALVQCDQALGTAINNMNLNTLAHRDKLLLGSPVGGLVADASFQIWIKGISSYDFNVVVGAINGAGCSLVSSNINNNAKGLPHWNYVVARMKCSTIVQWNNLVNNQAFYSRVAFSERSYSVDALTSSGSATDQSDCKGGFSIPPRIAIWQGKVNQHSIPVGGFATDPDGSSGAELLGVGYCQKWFPNTISIREYQQETITGWRDAGNTGGPYTRTLLTYECVQPSCSSQYKKSINKTLEYRSKISLSDKDIAMYKQAYDNMMRSINEYNTTSKFEYEQKKRYYDQICPEQYVRDQIINALETEDEKKQLRIQYQDQCDGNTPPPPYYPPPYYPPPPSGPQCPEQYIRDQKIDQLETEEEKKALRYYYYDNCPPYEPPPPPYIPPSDFTCSQVSEGQNAYLSCPAGKVIKRIVFASYGTSAYFPYCDDRPRPRIDQSCHSGNTEYLVNQKCCGQTSCTVPATNALFIDPCVGRGKTLRIKAECDYPAATECAAPICGTWNEGSRVYMGCPNGLVIKDIRIAAYGSTPYAHCYNEFAIPGNCNFDAKPFVESRCKDRTSCDFSANSANFGDPCPGQAKKFVIQAYCATHEPYKFGFEQSTSMQPRSNYNWENNNGRSWTNYLENMEWSSSVDYYFSNYGGTFYLLDIGVFEDHPELLNYNSYPYVTRIKRLPNVMNPDPAQLMDGFMTLEDRTLYDDDDDDTTPLTDANIVFVGDSWIEDNVGHGTANAAILIGNTLGLARTGVQLYHAKVATEFKGLPVQAFVNALGSVNQLSGTSGHQRPSVVIAPFNFNLGFGYCYESRKTAVPPEPTCDRGLLDELATAYEKGTIVVLPSNNGYNFWDLYTNPQNGIYFSVLDVPYKNTEICDLEPVSAVPINVCNSATRVYDKSFNVWDLYMPVMEKTTQKPFIVAAHDVNNRLSRWRDIVYNANDDWTNPWWNIGSSNIGTCVDFSSFGVRLSRSAATPYGVEESHNFANGYREYPYLISGTSYATSTAAAIAMHTYIKYVSTSTFNPSTIEDVRSRMANNGNRNYDDYDKCRNNYWNNNEDTTSYPRTRFF